MPIALYALTVGAFGIGVTEFVIMGLLKAVGADLGVSIASAGLLVSGYALGVVIGAPLLTALTAGWNRKHTLLALMVIFILGNLACALAPGYWTLMAGRLVTALAHGTFFGVGSVTATGLVREDRKASAIAVMFTGLTVANVIGVPFGTWLGQTYGWRSTFFAVAGIGAVALVVLAVFLPSTGQRSQAGRIGDEIKGVLRGPVLVSLSLTVLGFAGVFALFTYIAPILTEVTGLPEASVSPILLVFGGGLVVGNLAGGRLADRNLGASIYGTLAALAVVLLAMTFVLSSVWLTILFVGLLGGAGFATVAPLQARVMHEAGGVGAALASSLNIAAFNLGNAIGAWTGGLAIDHGPGLSFLPLVAAVFPLLALLLAVSTRALAAPAETVRA
ncbi:MFS transporter [Rhizobium halophytocola]|uniref:DHA1 family inner membrane transport protein n=1 Tax=Rhizobium halophytocola TaxID=735519 RepID=A0ABS4DYP2_9HYPH|nr:MFS transporter [Rhizobium halophytocola]MBP1850800.1 DHA1 family inner membrane transport protein [Rhizobium halophytocola]